MNLLSIESLLVAVWLFVIAVTVGTESAKKWLWIPAWLSPVYLSWAIGLLSYAAVVLLKFVAFSFMSVMVFMILLFATNLAYKENFAGLKSALRWLLGVER